MIIGIDIRELREGTFTGIGAFLLNFLDTAARSFPRDRFVLYGDRNTQVPVHGPNIVYQRSSAPGLFFDHYELARRLRKDRVDVFFSPYYKAPTRCPCPYVVTIHDLLFLELPESRWEAVLNRLRVPLMRRWAAGARRVITDSRHSCRDIKEILEIPISKISVIPLAVSPDFLPAAEDVRASARLQYGIPERFVLYVGSFKPNKNPGGLLQAYGSMPAELRAEYSLVFVGSQDGHYRRFHGRHAGLISELANIHFLPAVPRDRLIGLYSCASLCVVPSLYEGFGLPALEAMACGAPVLASNRTSLPEVVGEAGVLSDPDPQVMARVMTELLRDPQRRRRMRSLGLERARTFSCERFGRAIYAVLEAAAGARA